MKKWFLLAMLGFSVSGWASGPSTGGGGFVVSCPATQVSSAEVQLLDLYESTFVLGFSLVQSVGNLKDDYFASADRTYTIQGRPHLAEEIRSQIDANLVAFLRSVKFVARPEDLPVANDLGHVPWIPSQCSIKQVAFFEDGSTTIYILKDLWDQMSTLNKAATVSHELYGRRMRQLGEPDSTYARRTVGHIYAESGFTPILNGLDELNHEFSGWDIHGKSTYNSSFFRQKVNLGTGRWRFQFTDLAGRPVLAKTFADFKYLDWMFQFGRSSQDPSVVGCILTTPGIDSTESSKIIGTMAAEETLSLVSKTGSPLKLVLSRGNKILAEEWVRPDSILCP